MYSHIYIYIYTYLSDICLLVCSDLKGMVREDLSTGYGLRFSTDIYGSKRGKHVFHEYLQEYCFVLSGISEHLRKPPEPRVTRTG